MPGLGTIARGLHGGLESPFVASPTLPAFIVSAGRGSATGTEPSQQGLPWWPLSETLTKTASAVQ